MYQIVAFVVKQLQKAESTAAVETEAKILCSKRRRTHRDVIALPGGFIIVLRGKEGNATQAEDGGAHEAVCCRP